LQKDKKEVNINRIRFVPCAIPDLNFSEIEIKSNITIGHTQVKTAPLAIEVDNEIEAKMLHKTKRYELFYSNAYGRLLYLKNGILVDSKACKKPTEVANGLELAKCIRMGMAPCLVSKGMLEQFETIEAQLRIAMFLVNAKKIQELKKANIYVI
jgi:hypothetical protein